MMNDQTVEEGLIKFNDKTHLCFFKLYRDSDEVHSFRGKDLLYFDYYDDEKSQLRKFYSLPWDMQNPNSREVQFFELIGEFPEFTVLSTKGFVRAEISKAHGNVAGPIYPGPFGDPFAESQLSHSEGIFFVDKEGTKDLYLVITQRDVDGIIDYSKTKSRVIKKDILEKYFARHFKEVMAYAKINKLKTNSKDDLIQMLDYYESLIQNEK